MLTKVLLVLLTLIGCVYTRCPDGWTRYGESCYLFGHNLLSFDDAEAYCVHHGGHLANIETAEENIFIKAILKTLKAPKHWIGLTDSTLEDIWKFYPSEITAEYLDWHPSQPEQGLDANCGAIWESFDYQYVDEPCQNKFNAICEIPAPDDCETEIVG